MQVSNTYDELASRTVVDLGCGTVRPSTRNPAGTCSSTAPYYPTAAAVPQLQAGCGVSEAFMPVQPHARVFFLECS